MDTTEPLLLQLIRATLTTFPALQLAIEQGMGGSEAKEKELWMGIVIHDFILENQPEILSHHELSDYVAEILDNEFDTVVEDASITMIGRNLENLCRLNASKKYEEMNQRLAGLLSLKPNSTPLQSSSEPTSNNTNTTMTLPSSLVRNTETQTSQETENKPIEDDGWTVVHRKRH